MPCCNRSDEAARLADGFLNDDERREFEAHAADCPGCRAEIALQERIRAALETEPPSPLSADFAARVTARAFASVPRRRRRWPLFVPAGVAALGVAGLAVFGGSLFPVRGFGSAVGGSLGATLQSSGDALSRSVAGLTSSLPVEFPIPAALDGQAAMLAAVSGMFLVTAIWGAGRVHAFLRS